MVLSITNVQPDKITFSTICLSLQEANDTAQSDTRTLIIGAADKVVGKIDNSDQAKKITGVLSDVTKVTTQLTSDSKVCMVLCNTRGF